MNCEEARRYWDLYYDSEGEPTLYFQINEHLETCPACAEWFYRQGRLEDVLSEKLRRGTSTGPTPEPTAELWKIVLERSGLQPQSASPGRGLLWGSLLALAASVLLAVFLIPAWRTASSTDLMELTLRFHEDFAEGRQLVEFASGSDDEVEDYLRRRVSFPVRCPPRQDSGFLVDGAGISRMAGADTAYLTGRVQGRPVSIFILSREDLSRFPQQRQALRRHGAYRCRTGAYELVMTEFDRNVILVVGGVPSDQLLRVLRAYGSYPDHHRIKAPRPRGPAAPLPP